MLRELTQIGKLFYFFRKQHKLSREQFCEHICSPKYIYLIEKGERTPSIQVLEALSFKHGIEFNDYLLFIDYGNPFLIKDTLDQMDNLMIKRNFSALRQITEAAQSTEEFSTPPFNHRIAFNFAWLLVNETKEYGKAIELLNEILNQLGSSTLNPTPDSYPNFRPLLRSHGLLAICTIQEGDLLSGLTQLQMVYNQLLSRRYLESLKSTFISVALNLCYALSLNKNFDQTKAISHDLIEFQKKINHLDRLHLSFSHLGHALYHLGHFDESKLWLQKSIQLATALDCHEDIQVLMQIESLQWALKTEPHVEQ